jgi:hypothetical protein
MQQIADWLQKLGLGQYAQRFAEKGIDLSVLHYLVFITVQGWYRNPAALWWPLDNVYVLSRMIPMDSTMTIQSVQFKQDSQNGTETEIELRFPWGLNSNVPIGPLALPAPGPVQPGEHIEPTP